LFFEVAVKFSSGAVEAISKELETKDENLAFVAGATGKVGSRAVRSFSSALLFPAWWLVYKYSLTIEFASGSFSSLDFELELVSGVPRKQKLLRRYKFHSSEENFTAFVFLSKHVLLKE
jgi:hypothetical protein